MARERMVTRTVLLTTAEVMCVNVDTANVVVNSYELSGTFSDMDSVLKQLRKTYETENFKLVTIQNLTEREVLYGMSEVEFIKLAKELPPRNKYSE